MGKCIWLIVTRIGSIAFAIYILLIGWDFWGPQLPEVSPARQAVADRAVVEARKDLVRAKGAGIHDVVLLQLDRDENYYVTDQLRRELEAETGLNVRGRPLGEKARRAVGMRHRGYGADELTLASEAEAEGAAGVPEAVLNIGIEAGADGVIVGRVHEFSATEEDRVAMDVEINLVDVANGKYILVGRYPKPPGAGAGEGPDLEEVKQEIRKVGWLQRFVGWLVIVLLLPVFTITFIRSMVRKKSNASNAFTLGVYTVADALLAYLLLGPGSPSWIFWILLLVVVAFAFAYNIALMTFAVRLET